MKMLQCEKLLEWYDKNKRPLPWRDTSKPYKIWLSEVIMQQTRVEQGLAWYLKFVERYPDVFALAAATEDEVLKLWQGLGYYSRARNLHHSAKIIAGKYQGVFPSSYEAILALKGVGPYTAAAIASICFGLASPVIDGNVMRVVSRWYAIRIAVNSTLGKKTIHDILEQMIDRENPGLFNQAIMEFGALHCTPHRPDCESCPFRDKCQAFHQNIVGLLPIKTKAGKTKKRWFYYLLIKGINEGHARYYFRKRPAGDIWQGLYEFPLIETKTESSPGTIIKSQAWKQIFGKQEITVLNVSKTYKHQLTHRTIMARFFEVDIHEPLQGTLPGYNTYDEKDLASLPLPRLIDRYLSERPI